MEIQWFPGHMLKTQRLIQEHRSQVDCFLEVVDARAPLATANPLLDELLGEKPRVVLLNKIDLADPRVTSAWKSWYECRPDTRAVLISCKERKNLPAIHQAMNDLCRGKKWFGLRKVRGMIVGVPNVGKSSLINALAGGKKASVANKPGHTKGLQRINVGDQFDLFDTPGILWHKFDDPAVGLRLAFLGSVKDEILSVSDLVRELVVEVTRLYPQAFASLWAETVQVLEETEGQVFDRIGAWALRRGMLAKGAEVDWDRAFAAILSDFRGGKLGRFSLERPPVSGTAGSPPQSDPAP
ncbi:MAG TPA: ribosome biogenesis GTPase YlqF [Spirochaetia bacterium]|nr:ribosome biogenesis GTPase YlqF [Spirochaetia bacterium]